MLALEKDTEAVLWSDAAVTLSYCSVFHFTPNLGHIGGFFGPEKAEMKNHAHQVGNTTESETRLHSSSNKSTDDPVFKNILMMLGND